MSGAYLKQLLTFLDAKSVYVNVISKSGSTMEPALAFRVLKQYMDQRYGAEAGKRIIVTTDAEKGILYGTDPLYGPCEYDIELFSVRFQTMYSQVVYLTEETP